MRSSLEWDVVACAGRRSGHRAPLSQRVLLANFLVLAAFAWMALLSHRSAVAAVGGLQPDAYKQASPQTGAGRRWQGHQTEADGSRDGATRPRQSCANRRETRYSLTGRSVPPDSGQHPGPWGPEGAGFNRHPPNSILVLMQRWQERTDLKLAPSGDSIPNYFQRWPTHIRELDLLKPKVREADCLGLRRTSAT